MRVKSVTMRRAAWGAMTCALAVGMAQAQTTYDWKDTAPDGNWKQGAGGARWYPGDLWDQPPNSQILRFNNNAWLSMNNNVSSFIVHKLWFGSLNTSSRTIAGNDLSFSDYSGTYPFIWNDSTGTHTISLNITGSSSHPLELKPVSGDLILSGNLNNNGQAVHVYGSNSKMLTLSGVVSGSGKLILKENSKIRISGASTYTGNTELDRGEFWIATSGKLAQNNAIYVGSGSLLSDTAKFWLESSGVEITNNITVNSGNADTRYIGGLNTSGTATYFGSVTLNTAVNLEANDAGGTVVFAGAIGGAHDVNINKNGAGVVRLSNSGNTYSGRTIVQKGTLAIGNDGQLGTAPGSATHDKIEIWSTGTLAGTNDFTISANRYLVLGNANGPVISVDSGKSMTYGGVMGGDANWTKNGAGTLSLTGTASTNKGQVSISAGTLKIDNDRALGAEPASAATKVEIGSSGTFEAAGNFTLHANRSISVGSVNGPKVSVTSGNTMMTAAKITGSAHWSKESAGTLKLTGSSSDYTATLTINNGAVNVQHQNALGTTAGGTTVSSGSALQLEGGITTLAEALGLSGTGVSSDGALRNVSGDNTYAGAITLNAASRINSDSGTLTLDVTSGDAISGPGVNLAIGGAGGTTLKDPLSLGAGAITKDGTGMLTMWVANSLSGDTSVSNGSLKILNGDGSASGSGTAFVNILGTLTGTGRVYKLNVGNGGKISPGLSPGTMTAGDTTFDTNGVYVWEINDFAGSYGADPGWDRLNSTGTLTIASTADNTFTVRVTSLTLANAAGNAANFNLLNGYTQFIASAVSISGFATNKFTLNTTSFSNPFGGTWSIARIADTNIAVVYTPPAEGDLAVFGNSSAIGDGDIATTPNNHTDFGDVLVDGATLTRTYTITNTGNGAVGIGNLTTNGTAAEFVVTAQPADELAVGAFTTFQVQFNPSAAGARMATIQFTNTLTTAKSTYSFAIAGTGAYVEVAVSGNAQNIADGDTTPAAADHTEFGNVGLLNATLSRTFTITNTGNRAMTVGNVTTSGTAAVDFIVTTQPAATLNPSNSTTFVVQFDPSAVGLRTAVVSFATTDDSLGDSLTENPFDFTIQGTGVGPAITNYPTSFSLSTMVGSPVANQIFSITNCGLGDLTFTLATNASWLTVAPVSATLAAGAGQVVTASVNVAGLHAGVSNAQISFASSNATNTPSAMPVALTLTDIPSPTSTGATADGKEMIRFTVAEAAGREILVVHRAGSALTADPTNTGVYAVGDSIGGGSVIARFIGSSTVSNWEHVVATGMTHYYRFYAINNNHYSPAVDANATVGAYRANIGVETFSYTNLNLLNGRAGGTGWAAGSSWSESTANAFTNESGSLPVASGYPVAAGNLVSVRSPSGAGNGRSATRDIPSISSGRFYAAFVVSYQFAETGAGEQHYFGMSLMSNTTELAFFGEGAGADETVSLDSFGTGTPTTRNVALSNGLTHAYTIIGAYDFGSRVLKVKAYHNATNTVTAREPDISQWDSVVTTAVGRINMITGLRLAEGTGGGGSGHPGTVRFDEVRFATNWPNLLDADATYPVATNFIVNGGSNVTDQQVKDGTFSVEYHIRDAVGMETTNAVSPFFVPNFDLFNANAVQILTNETFGATNFQDNGRTFAGVDSSHAAVDLSQVVLGSYSSRWSAVNSNGLAVIDHGSLSNGTALAFNVVDDDTAGPVHSDFMLGAQELHGAYLNYSDAYGNDGFVVTGLVTDASGVYGGTSNRYVVTAPDGTIVDSGYFNVGFADGGGISGGSLSNTFHLSKPHNEGAHTVTVYSVDYDLDRPGDSSVTTSRFRFSVGPQPDMQLLQVAPTSITHHVMFGNNASNFEFAVTNGDWGTLVYTVTQTYEAGPGGWVSLTPSGATLKHPKHAHHTGTVSSASFTNVGTHVMTNVVDGNQVNTGAQFVVVNIVVTNIPEPQSVSAVADGNEMVRLSVAEAAGREVLVFHSLGNTGLDFPTNGNFYSAGDVVGNSRILFKFTGSATASNFEHVVAAGSTNYYRFYAINNSRYSPAATASVAMGQYPAGMIVEQFAYTNATSLASQGGGSGWSGAWTVTGNSWTSKFNAGSASVPYFHNMPFYPAFKANRTMASAHASGSEWKARRDFAQVSSGKIYASYVVAIRYKGSGKYTGMRLCSNGVEKVFFGETGGDNILGIDGPGIGQQNSSFAMNAYDDGIGTDTGNVYLVIGRYDFTTRQFDTKAYYRTNAIPETEPSSWDKSVTLAAGAADSLNGIEIVTGGFAGGYPGDVFFDEVRISTAWIDVLDVTKPYLTNYVVGVTNQVTDGQMTGGTYSIVFDLYSRGGMTNSATFPNIDILDPAGNALVTDRPFATFAFSDGGRQMLASNGSVTTVSAASVVLGVHTSRWSAFDSNSASIVNSTTMSNGAVTKFTVVDDDDEVPAFGTALDGRAMSFTIGGTNYGGGTGTNGIFAVTDAGLAQVSAANPMKFIFNIYDHSGIARGNGGTVTNLNFDVGASGATNIFATFASGLSDADTTLATATSVFHHTTPFTVGGSGATENSEVFKMIQAVSNTITVSALDLDRDRTSDATNIIDHQAGILVVTDDDTNGPVAELLYVGTNYTFGATNNLTIEDGSLSDGGLVTIAYRWYDPSGLFVTNTDLTKTNILSGVGNVNMNWDLTNSIAQASVSDRIHNPAELHGRNGDLYVTNVLLNITAIDFSKNADGIWHLSVSAQDHDMDRGTYDPGATHAGTSVSYDRAIRTNQLLAFTVGDDDVLGPNAPAGQVVVAGHDWTNADFSIQWSTSAVTDASGIFAYRVSTNAPSDIIGGTNAGLGTSFVWNVSAAHEGVKTNFLYALDNDNDRTNDRMYGAAVTFTTKLDRTPPALITNIAASITAVSNDLTQIRLAWSVLTNAGIRASDGDPLSPWKTYIIYHTSDGSEPTTNSAAIHSANGPSDLGAIATASAVISNLAADTIYKFAIAGLDTAGNYGTPSAVVTQRTAGVVLTQSVVTAGSGVKIQWNMKQDIAYDVLYQDAASWANGLTNTWSLLFTVTNSYLDDTGTAVRTPPLQLTSTMRFYRVSGSGQWRTNHPTRSASPQISVAKTYSLMPGENWVALACIPESNTIAQVLGTNRLPAGITLNSGATKVSWYSATNASTATSIVWLATSGNWMYSAGGEGLANDKPLPLHEGFSIEIPPGITTNLIILGRLPTNALTYTIGAGGPGLTNDHFNVRSRGVPVRVTLGASGYKSVLTGAPNQAAAPDEIRILQTTNGTGRAALKARAWLRSTDNTFRYYTSGTPSAEGLILEPGESIIIVRRNAGTTTMTNTPPYTPPNRNINP